MLILLSGVVAILLFLALLMLQISRSLGRSAEAGLASARARMAAASGVEYGASRLWDDPSPLYGGLPETRGAGWAVRGPSADALPSLRGPSFSHGESWIDSAALPDDGVDDDGDGIASEAEGEGIWSSGEPWVDLDGDGRFSGWTGRLRGGRTPFESRFSLQVASPDGGIPLNAGYLDGYRHSEITTDTSPVGPAHPYHLGLVHLLNNLGALVLPDSPRRERVTPYPLGETFLLSWLGRDLIGARPVGGYRAMGQVRSALLSLGYTGDEIDRVEPFLDLGPSAWEAEGGRAPAGAPYLESIYPNYWVNRSWEVPAWNPYLLDGARVPWHPPAYAPVCLSAAPREVLRALWMYLAGYTLRTPSVDSDWDLLNGHAGGNMPYRSSEAVLFSGETSLLADFAARLRKDGAPTWKSFRQGLLSQAGSLFPTDALDLSGADPVTRSLWLGTKADLAYQAVAQDPYPYARCRGPLRTWEGWGIDRFAGGGLDQFNLVPFEEIRPIDYPVGPGGWASPAIPFTTSWKGIVPQGLTLAPPVRYRILSAGTAGPVSVEAEGGIRIAQRIDFITQEDLEALNRGIIVDRLEDDLSPAPVFNVVDRRSQGLAVLDLPGIGQRMDVRTETFGGETRPAHPHVVSLPRWSPRTYMTDPAANPHAVPDGKDNDGDGSTDEPGEWNGDGIDDDLDSFANVDMSDRPGERNGVHGFSRCYGALALASVERGLDGAKVYYPGSMRYDYDPANDLAGEKDPGFAPAVPSFVNWRYRTEYHEWGGFTENVSDPYWGGGSYCPLAMPVKTVQAGTVYAIDEASIELYLPPETAFKDNGSLMSLEIRRDFSGLPSTRVRFGMTWPTGNSNRTTPVLPACSIPFETWTFPDGVLPGDPRGPYHILITFKRKPQAFPMPSWTEVRLYINGYDKRPDGTTLLWEPLKAQAMSGTVVNNVIYANGIGMRATNASTAFFPLARVYFDELRFFDQVVDPATRYALSRERFYRSGTFISPLYRLEAPSRLRKAQWFGMIPDGYPPGCLQVEVEGYDNPDGSLPALFTRTLPLSGASGAPADDLSGEGEIRSFRYRVLFKDPLVPVMHDTPVFESIWLTLSGNGRTPIWTAWESR